MTFLTGNTNGAEAVALLPAAFNPPTRAHVALAGAALSAADRVVLVLPRVLPHKHFHGAEFEQRQEMICDIARLHPNFAAAVSDRGLFVDLAEEFQALQPAARVLVVCGRDAAERIAGWDYGEGRTAREMLDRFELLVADRSGRYPVPRELSDRVRTLPFTGFEECSSSEVRERIARGDDWRHLVPEPLADRIAAIYGEGRI